MTTEEAQAVIDARGDARDGLLADKRPNMLVTSDDLARMAAAARRETGTPEPGAPQTREDMAEDILNAMFPNTGDALLVLMALGG